MAKFPAFNLPGSDGSSHARKDIDGPYIVYFYPKDMTPGCTTESCEFRDNIKRLEKLGIHIYGISADSIARHEKFIAKHDLNFVLLSDEEHVLMEKIGVWAEKKMYGKTFMGIVRSTFLVAQDHTILREWRKVRVKGHVDEVLAAAEELL